MNWYKSLKVVVKGFIFRNLYIYSGSYIVSVSGKQRLEI